MKEDVFNMKNFKLKKEQIKQLTEINGGCITSDKITVDGQKVGYMYRENPTNETDSGWRFFSGNEDESYTNNSDNFSIFDVNTVCNYDETIIPYLSEPVGSRLERENNSFKKVID